MVEIFLRFTPGGFLRECRVTGHAAGGTKGKNLACAAVTVLVRTAVRTLENRKELILTGKAPEPGELSFSLNPPASEQSDWLLGVTDSLMTGLLDLQEDFPEECRVYIDRQGKE